MTSLPQYLAPGMPVAQSFPQPTSFPALPTDPRFGGNPYARPQSGFGATTPLSQAQANGLSAMGMPASTQMTEEEARQQSAVALAKLATVNPELAQKFADQQNDTGSGGFFGFLGDVASAIFSPVLSVGGEILDIIGRTSHIVPQWFNPDDQGNWFEDIGQALSGEDKTNWNEVLKNRGWDSVGWLRATVGFGLDVLTDPLTYATFAAGAGVSAAEKGAMTAKTLATRTPSILRRLSEIEGIGGIDEASSLLTQAWSHAGGAADNVAFLRKVSDGGSEELMGMFAKSNRAEVEAVLADAFDIGAQGYAKGYARTMKNFLHNPDAVLKSSRTGEALVTSGEVKPLFEAIAKSGNWASYADGSWSAAKAAAGVLGGTRFRFAVPFTNFRYISPLVPGSWRLGMATVGRFGAGLSAFKAVEKLGPEAEALFLDKGWKGVSELAEDASSVGHKVAKDIVENVRAGRADFVKSSFYSASETVGHMTAHFSPGAQLFRRGLGYYFARHGAKNAKELRATLTNDLFYHIKPTESGYATRSDLYRRYDNVFGRRSTLSVEQVRDARRYVDYFGHKDIPKSTLQDPELDAWFWQSRPDRAEAKFRYDNADAPEVGAIPGAQEYEAFEGTLAEMRRVRDSLPEEARLVLDDMVTTEAYGKTTLERHGIDVGDSAVPVDKARVIHPDDLDYLGQRPEGLRQNFDAVLPAGVNYQGARYGGVTPEFSVAHEDLGVSGVRIDLTGGSATNGKSVPVQLRVRNLKDVNMEDIEGATAATAETIVSGDASLPEILAAVDKALDDQGAQLAKQLNPLLDNHILKLDWDLSTRSDLATEVMRNAPNAPDGVRFLRDGKPESMVIFDQSKVHVVSETAKHLLPQGGYFRRVLTPGLKAKLGGEARKGEGRIFGDPAQIELGFRRETRDMSLEEAERHIRNKVNSSGGRYEGITIADDEDVFQWDVLKGHEEYIGYLGDSYFATAMGRVTSRSLQLGNLVPQQFGAVANTARVQFQTPAGMMSLLARSDRKVQDAAIKMQQRQTVAEQKQFVALTDAHERISTMLAYMEAGLRVEDVPPSSLASSMDGVVRSAARLQEVVATENARLTGHLAELDQQLATTRGVERAMHVDEFEDLDRFIDEKIVSATDEAAATEENPLNFIPPPRDSRDWQRETLKLRRASANGEAQDMGNGVYKIVNEPRTTDELAGGRRSAEPIEIPGYTQYLRVDAGGNVVAYRDVADSGEVITSTASDAQREGHAGALILAHWADEGVDSFESIKRLAGAQTFSPDGAGLNKWAARKVMAQQGIHDPELVRDLLARGELYTGKDGSILTKKGGIRKGGKRVRLAQDIEDDTVEARRMLHELDDLRQKPKKTIYAAELSFEDYDTMAARRELEAGGAYERDQQLADMERVDYQVSEVDDVTRAARIEAQQYEIGEVVPGKGTYEGLDDQGRPIYTLSMGDRDWEAAGFAPGSNQRMRDLSETKGIEQATNEDILRALERDVQAEQVARAGLTAAQEAAAQDDFAARLFDAAGVGSVPTEESFTSAQRRAMARYSGQVDRAVDAVGKGVSRTDKAARRRGEVIGRARMQVARATTEMNRAIAEAQGVWSEMKPAVEFGLPPVGGKTGMREVQIPGLSNVFAHPYVAEEMEYLFRGKVPGHFASLWREFVLGPWKRWATYRNPGFHVRNFFGAWFNNSIGGVDGADHEFARLVEMARGDKKEWARTAVSDKHWKRYNFDNIAGMAGHKGVLTYGDLSEMLADMGIGRANTTSLAMTMGGEGLRDKARGAIGSTFTRIDTGLRNAGGLTEDFFRTAAWAGGMRHTQGDLYGSRAFTMMRHGDYADLTETEDFVRDLVPFYKWMRTNVPYQFRMMAENPGYYATLDKAQTFAYDVQGLNRQEEERKMPDWMKKGYHLPIPKGVPIFGSDDQTNYLMFDLPYSDLYNGLRDYLSSGLPVIRNLVESYGIKQSVFTGAPLGNKMVPLSGLWANPVLAPLISALPFATRGPNGEVFIPDTFENVLGAVPQYSRFRNWMSADPSRVENRMGTFTSALLGIGFRAEDATAEELSFYYDELLPAMDNMRSMGYTFPTAEDLVDAGGIITDYGGQPTADQLYPDGVVGSTTPLST